MKGQSTAEFREQLRMGLIGENAVKELYERAENTVVVLGDPSVSQRDINGRIHPDLYVWSKWRAFYSEVKTKSRLFRVEDKIAAPLDVRLVDHYKDFSDTSLIPLIIHVYDIKTATLYGQNFKELYGKEIHFVDWDKSPLICYDINLFLKEGPCF